ncbi:MAG TPA: TetR/AcrR family transcriptional regulator [Sphingobacteriaceae bacterium]
MDSQDRKRDLIIDAALKRFAHFGLSKTTMTEIAQDLNISKALLYYYFPDKIQLYAAVMGSLIEAMGKSIDQEVKSAPTTLECFFIYLEKRQEFVRTHYNLLAETGKSPEMPVPVRQMFEKALEAERLLIAEVIAAGVRRKEIAPLENPGFYAELFLDALAGIRLRMRQYHTFILPDRAMFAEILEKEKSLATVFLKGLQ